MVRGTRGFTLPELLAVIAIIALVAAITFPVVRAARHSALRGACVSNFNQATVATQLYLNDYDDTFMLTNYRVVRTSADEIDRTWVQLLLPYLKSFDVFRCPADSRSYEKTRAVFDADLFPGDTYDRYYRASLLSNIGYNYLYLSPIMQLGSNWLVVPKTLSQIADPASMILFVDTVNIHQKSNEMPGGGSYIVAPPCRFTSGANGSQDSFGIAQGAILYSPTRGWLINGSNQTERYGRAWAWHMERTVSVRVAGGIRSHRLEDLAAGCDVRDKWGGLIKDSGRYAWDNN